VYWLKHKNYQFCQYLVRYFGGGSVLCVWEV